MLSRNQSNHPDKLSVKPSEGPLDTLKIYYDLIKQNEKANQNQNNQDDNNEREKNGTNEKNQENLICDLQTKDFVQDVNKFGLAGKVWDRYGDRSCKMKNAYALDLYLRMPNTTIQFNPPCPIPPHLFSASTHPTSILTSVDNTNDNYIILELGSGTGYVGISLSRRLKRTQAKIILTDLEQVLPLIRHNLTKNSQSLFRKDDDISVNRLEWGSTEDAKHILSQHNGSVDLVIASDLVYFPELFQPLIRTLLDVCNEQTVVVFGYKKRASWKEETFWLEVGRFFELNIVQIVNFHKDKKNFDDPKEDNYDDKTNKKNDYHDDETNIFGEEEGIYVFLARKKLVSDYQSGVDTFTILTLGQINI
ncbi:hypothetical protein G9A89_010884 [Geosiphon pyriformis]|nr:hypothetical protein G9A89_010884 [Geosiphon pyriformis]